MVRGLARNADVAIATWWTDYALDWHRHQGSGGAATPDAALHESLGLELARKVSRKTPWSRATIRRFFIHGTERITSAEIADALRVLYPTLPPYSIEPGDLPEALELQAVHVRHVERRARAADELSASQEAAIDAIAARAIEREREHAKKTSTPDPSQTKRQGSARRSVDAAVPGPHGGNRGRTR